MSQLSMPTFSNEYSPLLSRSRAAQQQSERAAYLTLQSALEIGWQVEPPIYEREDWSLKARDRNVFHFILKHGQSRMTTLLSVPDGAEVRRLIDEQGWEIDE